MFKRWSLTLLLVAPVALGQDACSHLSSATLPDTIISLAQPIAPGALRLQNSDNPAFASGSAFHDLPTFCRVSMILKPTPDSSINVELWLPEQHWNGKLLGIGNGGFAGKIDYDSLASDIREGYAAAATDTGHTGSLADARWALGHPEKITDFAYRAIHMMTVQSKALLRLYYGRPPAYSYFESCSNGGRQGLMEAQRFPNDYSGILSGAPANNWTGLVTTFAYLTRALNDNPESRIPPDKLPAIQSAVLAACDAQDGVRDGVVTLPPSCHFDPSVLLCKNEPSASCLTQPQVTALESIYTGLKADSGNQLFPGFAPGGELGPDGWAPWILGDAANPSLHFDFSTQYFSNMVYDDPSWSLNSFRADRALADALRRNGSLLNATDPDLRPFARHGGKLILYHGWSDAAIPPQSTIDYYGSVRTTVGPAASDKFLRLYMVPGMQHCGNGPGADSFGENGPTSVSGPDDPEHDIRLALERWVEKGQAPQTLIGAHYDGRGADQKLIFARPLCPYPSVVTYDGHGPSDSASSFTCVKPDGDRPSAPPQSR